MHNHREAAPARTVMSNCHVWERTATQAWTQSPGARHRDRLEAALQSAAPSLIFSRSVSVQPVAFI